MSQYEVIAAGRAERSAWTMTHSLQPKFYVTMIGEADATSLSEIRVRSKAAIGEAPSYTAFVIKAGAVTLKRNPVANRAILGPPFFKKLCEFKSTDISVAVEKNLPAQPGAPYAPTVANTLGKSAMEITKELREFAACDESNDARFRLYMRILKYVPRPLNVWIVNFPFLSAALWLKHRGCAAWVNAPSKAGADLVFSTWPWPVTFSFGVVKERPAVINGQVQARIIMPITMTFDRRIMGGGPGSRIFVQFKELLETADSQII